MATTTAYTSPVNLALSRQSDPRTGGVSYRHVTIRGHRLFIREAGQPDAPALVLLHGFPSSSHMFRDLIPLLAPHFRVIAPDYLGFGYSDAPSVGEFTYTFDALTELVDELLESIGVSSYTLYMQDYGGPVGFRLATAHPERITGLIIQNANAYLEGVGEPVSEVFLPLWKERTEETERAARIFLSGEATRFQYTEGAHDPFAVSPDGWTHDTSLLARPGVDEINLALFVDYQSNVALYDEWHQYLRTHQPRTLILWGENDPLFVKAGAEAYRRDLADCDIHYFDGGHFLLEEYASEAADRIVAWAGLANARQTEATVRRFYESMAGGDVPGALNVLADSLEWTEAETFPYFSGTWRTPNEVLEKLFIPISREWSNFAATPERFVTSDDHLVSLGRYTGTHIATGAVLDVPFAHYWRVAGGRVVVFTQFTDTAKVRDIVG